MKFRLFFLIGLSCLSFSILAKEIDPQVFKVESPNGKIVLTFFYEDDDLDYSLSESGKDIIVKSSIEMETCCAEFPGKSVSVNVIERKNSDVIKPVVSGSASTIKDIYNEKLICFSDKIALRARVYDDGAAFRWESNMDISLITVYAEEVDFDFASDFDVWFPIPNGVGFFSHHENMFNHTKISKVGEVALGCVPVLTDLKNGKYLLITDVNLSSYPGLWMQGEKKSHSLEAVFPKYPKTETLLGDRNLIIGIKEKYIAKVQGKNNFPWRAFLIGDSQTLLTSNFLYCLADETTLKDVTWIKPGLVVWDWWNSLNYPCVDFKSGVNQQTYKYNIDFASANNIPYVILDEGWSLPGPKNLLKVIPKINMEELSAYAESKNVGLILWMTSTALSYNFDKAFEQFKKWNIKGLKIDFMQRDDQKMMEFCYRTAEKAAEYKMVVNYHGGAKPAGITRTFPNVLTIESVQGLEQSKWGFNANPDMATLLPFTRMVVGPMDYTPGAMNNLQKDKFSPMFTSPSGQGTKAHQLAMYVVFLSPLQMLADTPCNYNKNPECLNFIKSVPVVWDETVFLAGKPEDKQVAVARRSGKSWYIGALSGWQGGELSINLSFLESGNYTITKYSDGQNADRDGNSIIIETEQVDKNSVLKIKLAKGGGFAAVIR